MKTFLSILCGALVCLAGLAAVADAAGFKNLQANRAQRQAARAFNQGFNRQLGAQAAAAKFGNVKVVTPFANVAVVNGKVVKNFGVLAAPVAVVNNNVSFKSARFNTFGTRTVVDGNGNVFEVDVFGRAIARGHTGGFNQFGGFTGTVVKLNGQTLVVPAATIFRTFH